MLYTSYSNKKLKYTILVAQFFDNTENQFYDRDRMLITSTS